MFRWESLFAATAEKTVHAAVAFTAIADEKQSDRQAVTTVEDPVKTTVFREKDDE